jgi:ABC-type antimicrobial peptide transport system permease subunit
MTKETKQIRPPYVAEKILKLTLNPAEKESLLGDFEEIFKDYAAAGSTYRAKLWYWREVLRSFTSFLLNSIYWRTVMLQNYAKTALRKIKKQRIYSFINIFGLAVGMAGCMMILLWVKGQTGINRFHKNIDNIYWVSGYYYRGDTKVEIYGTPAAWGSELKKTYPEIKYIARSENGSTEMLVEGGGKKLFEKVKFADLSIFKIFTFPLLKGSITDDGDPYCIIIDEDIATKYFGVKNPIGEHILIDKRVSLRVAAVFKRIPNNSTVSFKIVVPLQLQNVLKDKSYTENWESYHFTTYATLQDGVNWQKFNSQVQDFVKNLRPKDETMPSFFPFKDLYLIKYGQKGKVRLFSLIAFIILLIACINFMNLSTARSADRGLEVGLRKVVGACREQLVKQFFGETLILTILASIVSLILVVLLIPYFKSLAGELVDAKQLLQRNILLGIVAIILFTGFISGIYPALILSRFSPAAVLSGFMKQGSGGSVVRRVLVIAQFSAAIILMVVTLAAFRQFTFLKSKDIGFNKEQIIYLRVRHGIKKKCLMVKDELLKNPNVKMVTMSSDLMSSINGRWTGWKWQGMDESFDKSVSFNWMDEDFIRMFDLKLVQGREYKNIQSQDMVDVIINKTFADIIGKPNPIGMVLRNSSDDVFGVNKFRIVGVIKDFHHRSVTEKIRPLIALAGDKVYDYGYIYCKINPGKMADVQKHIQEVWGKFLPGYPAEFRFLDKEFENRFNRLKKEEGMLRSFAVLAILISCLGLFGLAAFMAEQKKREIAIRKVLGASSKSITLKLMVGFLKWVIVAICLAIPVGYWFSSKLLMDYAYRITLSPFYFIVPALITFMIAFITVVFHSTKASLTNPSDILKVE